MSIVLTVALVIVLGLVGIYLVVRLGTAAFYRSKMGALHDYFSSKPVTKERRKAERREDTPLTKV